MTKQRVVSGVAVFVGFVAVAIAGETSASSHAACFTSGQNPRVAVKLPAGTSSARLYFHAQDAPADYYIDMKMSPSGEAWAMLPKTAAGATGVAYEVRSTDAKGHEARAHSVTVPVSRACAAVPPTAVESATAANLAVGQTVAGQGTVPPGFLCDGIVSSISPAGETTAGLTCRAGDGLHLANGAGGNTPASGIVVKRDAVVAAKPLSSSRP